ncbi:hypothetical protein BTHERMOSOX_476 [Bathymodiolus thermophilus thioautotrophic gill symbiont]|uniref:DALR anticodon binding domain-containing protein n=1 Tax=Bathymodiolus thermophilus thioautotrophic gill symbiont TaxID=2360 RepID=A0A1J5TXW9_9GAMM|nr:hypothetical protein [Bathymodiolus thermophilus thioautotrophic gill symbiont]OIR25068.1 hypothetical protein BGC33_05395 [Bathymodiolus thermophilus thioautotrophic gill symbiont]SGZ97598.1 hypothetical protein BTHERMOSOX_476 [Bathymodiolus thermophilus thioautotrophic gill symbiont]
MVDAPRKPWNGLTQRTLSKNATLDYELDAIYCLHDLASNFHSYTTFKNKMNNTVLIIAQILANGLGLLSVSAPNKM